MSDDIFKGFGKPRGKKRGPKKGSRQPENIIQGHIISYLKIRDWYVINMHGNEYQMGVPDLYACHKRYGTRWVEVKRKEKYRFTSAQIDVFPELSAKGVGIWILSATLEDMELESKRARVLENEYQKLFKPANWYMFLDVMK